MHVRCQKLRSMSGRIHPLTVDSSFSAISFMIVAGLLNTIMLSAIKELSGELHAFEIALSLANWYSRGDREFEKATAVLFPSEIAQCGRMRNHTAAPFRRRVTV